VVGYQRTGAEFVHPDYAMNNGVTIRFGDGEFGRVPDKGSVFKVRYRLGGTRRSNVATNTLKNIDSKISSVAVTNPLPTSGGMDAETPAELRQLASDAFKAVTYRAVRPEDYAEAAERLPWVQKAGSTFRWTGSWLTAFVTPDPKGTVFLEDEKRVDLTNQLNRFRQAGREVNVLDPTYANIDLEIEICIASDAYAGQVKERVFIALMGKKGLRPQDGYFSPDRFTFGTFLERSTLEAAIQEVPGVKAIEKIYFRRRGWFEKRPFTELGYDPGKNTIIRIANNPLHPEQGTLKLYTHGGL
jgi:predicted phage baseplate assembly protein